MQVLETTQTFDSSLMSQTFSLL